jgi:glycosyl transferase family 25
MWEFLDKVIYINLDHRVDRLDNMKQFFEDANIPPNKIMRFSAINERPGTVGCTKSHIEILKMAIKNNFRNILILEDDAKWTGDFTTTYSKIKNLVESANDVVLLGGGYNSIIDKNRVLFSYCTSSYIVKSHYFERLLLTFEGGLRNLTRNDNMSVTPGDEERIRNDHNYEIDTFWSRLMRMDNWRAVIPGCVKQIASYSDVIDGIRDWTKY